MPTTLKKSLWNRPAVLLLAGAMAACVLTVASPARALDPFDPEVVLPGRVDALLHRTVDAMDRSSAAVDDRRGKAARKSLRALKRDLVRGHLAVRRQVEAPPPPEEGEESTAGPDSVLAGLNVDLYAVPRLTGLFDGIKGPALIRRIAGALATAQNQRAALIAVLGGLDPEGAGAAYADSLADTVPSYTDEVAGLSEALADDRLTPAARRTLKKALTRSRAAEAAMTALFGGGE